MTHKSLSLRILSLKKVSFPTLNKQKKKDSDTFEIVTKIRRHPGDNISSTVGYSVESSGSSDSLCDEAQAKPSVDEPAVADANNTEGTQFEASLREYLNSVIRVAVAASTAVNESAAGQKASQPEDDSKDQTAVVSATPVSSQDKGGELAVFSFLN